MEKLADVLSSLNCSPAQFAVSGVANGSPLPGLHLNDVGPISLPITSEHAKKIINIASDTSLKLTDDNECLSARHIDPKQISFMNSVFEEKLEEITTIAKKGLGCDNTNVNAEFFKMILYNKGRISEPLQDCEKSDGIQPPFAKLIVQLPSIFKGCHHKLQHGSNSLDIKFDNERSPYEMLYAAYYMGCKQDVTPLLSGYRLVLVYNLVWNGPSIPPSLSSIDKCQEELVVLLQKLLTTGQNGLFGWPLQNDYDGIHDISGLLGHDASVASSLKCANDNLHPSNCFKFYIVDLQRKTTEYGTFRKSALESLWFSDVDKLTDDTTFLSSGISFDGIESDNISNDIWNKMPFDMKNDLLNFDDSRSSDVKEFWGNHFDRKAEGPTDCGHCRGSKDKYRRHGNQYDSDDSDESCGFEDCDKDELRAVRTTHYRHSIILALGPVQMFRIFCKKNLNDGLQFLHRKYESMFECDRFDYFEILLQEDFFDDDIELVIQMLVEIKDVDLVKLFFNQVLKRFTDENTYWDRRKQCAKLFGLKYSGLESFSYLLKSVSWEHIKDPMDTLISKCEVEHLQQVFKLAQLSGISDFKNNVLEITCKKIISKAYATTYRDEEILSRFLTDLSISHPLEYLKLLDCFIRNFPSSSLAEQSINLWSLCVFTIIHPVMELKMFDEKLKELCHLIIDTGNVGMIARLFRHLIENKQSSLDTETCKILMEAFVQWVCTKELDAYVRDKILTVVKILFHDEFFSYQAQKFVCVNTVMNNIALLGDILSLLCCKENKENFLKLKSNGSFGLVVLNFIRLFQAETSDPVPKMYSIYSTIMTFLFADENWCHEVSFDLLPGLITANCMKNNFICYANIITSMPSYQSENYMMLLNSALNALNVFLKKVEILEYQNYNSKDDYAIILGFMKTLFSQNQSFPLHLPNLKLKDRQNILVPSVLVKLIDDLKDEFQGFNHYQVLLSFRIENLEDAISKGKPVICWNRPDAVLPDHPEVERFLRSSDQCFTFKSEHFRSITDARSWASKHFPSQYGVSWRKVQNSNNFYCQTFALGSGKNAYVKITKEFTPKEKSDTETFYKLSSEHRKLKALFTKIDKRATEDANVVPTKKPLMEKNVILN